MCPGKFCLVIASLAFLSSPAWSQTPPGQQPAEPRPPGLSVAPNAPSDQTEARQPQSSGGHPANICKELVAFLEQQEAKKAQASPQQGGQAPASDQASTGQTAPAVDKSQHSSGLTAPIPPGDEASTPSRIGIDEARAMAGSNDFKACQHATRQLRKAGTALPPGLLALAALRPELLQNMKTD